MSAMGHKRTFGAIAIYVCFGVIADIQCLLFESYPFWRSECPLLGAKRTFEPRPE